MAPLKFEDKMKEQLEQRTLRPSKESWKKIEKLLDAKKEEQKSYKNFWWMGIAAGFVGFLLIASIFMKSDDSENHRTNVYVDATEGESHSAKEETKIVEVKKPEDKGDIQDANRDKKNNTITSELQSSTSKKKTKNTTTAVAEMQVPEKNQKEQEIVTIDSAEIQEKVIAIASQVRKIQEKSAITDSEINDLLLQAQKEITMERVLKSSQINSSELLSEVESELDETFKEKVFEALKTGFQKIKSSVVERDN